MHPLSFIIVGSGFRSLFFARIAKRYPDLFHLNYLLCRTEEKAERLAREQRIPTTTSKELCRKSKPDFVVVAVGRGDVCPVAKEWIEMGFPVLLETPAGETVQELKELWELNQKKGARIQVAEQYHRYPVMAMGLQAVQQGKLGDPYAVALSVAHDYHGASLIRSMLHMTGFESMVLRGSRYTFPVTQTDSRYGPITDGSVKEQDRDHVTIEFASGKVAFYDFANIQYRSMIRSRHVNVRGRDGEWNDTILRYVGEDHLPVEEKLIPYLDPKYQVLETNEIKMICSQWNPSLTLDAVQDEYAIATMMFDMREYLENGTEGYCLADSLEDAYIFTLIHQAAASHGETVVSKKMPWHMQKEYRNNAENTV